MRSTPKDFRVAGERRKERERMEGGGEGSLFLDLRNRKEGEERRVLHHRPCHAAKEGRRGRRDARASIAFLIAPPFVFSAYVIRTQRPAPHHAHGFPLLRLFVLATSGEGKRDGDGLVFFLFLFPPKTCGRLRGCLGGGDAVFLKGSRAATWLWLLRGSLC